MMRNHRYDYLVVGSGLYGVTVSRLLADAGVSVLVVEKRFHVGGNAYDAMYGGVRVHEYGPHIFHTNDSHIWNFVNQFAVFHPYRHKVLSYQDGAFFQFPINLNTMKQFNGIHNKMEMLDYLEKHRIPNSNPRNLEEALLDRIGPELYELFFREYTQKQWGKSPGEMPVAFMARIPVRMTTDNYFFSDSHQGVPYSYTELVARMLENIPLMLNTDFFEISNWRKLARHLIFTGGIDQFFANEYGELEYVRVRFEHEHIKMKSSFQKTAVVNYPSIHIPYTRITEHRHFLPTNAKETVITREYPGTEVGEPCYPVPTRANILKHRKYCKLLPCDITPGGRLGLYRYFDMDQSIRSAVQLVKTLLGKTVFP